VKSSLRREPDVPGDLLCALFVNVTEPTVDFQIDGAEFDLYRDVKRESARAAAQDEDPRAGATLSRVALLAGGDSATGADNKYDSPVNITLAKN
jgi:hypothetical protein